MGKYRYKKQCRYSVYILNFPGNFRAYNLRFQMHSIWLIDHQDIYDVRTLERISSKSQISWPVKSSSWRISRPPYWRYAGKNAAAHLFPPQIFIRELSGNSWWHEVKWSEIRKPDTKKRATIFTRNSFIIKMVVGDGPTTIQSSPCS